MTEKQSKISYELAGLVRAANVADTELFGIGMPVSLLVGGTLISGIIIPEKDYVAARNKIISKSLLESPKDPKNINMTQMDNAPHIKSDEAHQSIDRILSDLFADSEQNNKQPAPDTIYLNGAKIRGIVGFPADDLMIAVAMSSVDAYFLGQIS